MAELLFKKESFEIVGAAMEVWNTLGYGFLEKVYENALAVELRKRGLEACQQHPLNVHYKGENVGNYYADIVVNNEIILEIKSVKSIRDEHVAQILNYLKATEMRLGIILNFGPTGLEHKRFAHWE